MSLVILSKSLNVKMPDFFSEIENKTGVKIESTRDSGDTYSQAKKITFSDGDYILISISLYDNKEYTVFIDDATHLFIFTNTNHIKESAGFSNNSTMTDFHLMFIVDIEGDICNIICSQNFYVTFNTTGHAKDDISKQSSKIVPAFCYYGYNGSQSGFLKNVYINYERRFEAGLKFVDENGNEFRTLGSYLLYKNN